MQSVGQRNLFRWRSLLGVAVILFLIYGALNVIFAILVPFTLHTQGIGGFPGLVLGGQADAALLGRSLAEIQRVDPGLNAYLVTFMDTMCMMMMPFGILQLGVTWFGLRRMARWALWTLVLANIAYLPYFAAITNTFASFGVTPGLDDLFFFAIFPIPLLVAIALGWIGLQGGRRPTPSPSPA